jgi:hypothetical protein
MRQLRLAFLGALGLGAILALATTAGASGGKVEPPKILEFSTMTPVVVPFTGATHAIRGIGGGGVPWLITSGRGELDKTGKLEVSVTGLVIASSGINPLANFIAAVNCLTTDSPDTGKTLLTAPQAVTAAGNASFEAQLTLPSPCVAPIVFVGTPAVVNNVPSLRWFATTGS